MTTKLNNQERELISIIRNAKDPAKAMMVAVEIMLQMLEGKETAI